MWDAAGIMTLARNAVHARRAAGHENLREAVDLLSRRSSSV
ncbi:hypothetical protein K788_0005240 [Paraburkholderia caribensis MBA4]|uniref:Uncharacterized protein n=1 Tax=Paraburkholderia caribensis MBA4 TaxID=1323664 RepID=A0A0P0RF14_9BURK|nr:hypothetical protein K788_0005240 [Paraburkholderia caribensis MBA4]